MGDNSEINDKAVSKPETSTASPEWFLDDVLESLPELPRVRSSSPIQFFHAIERLKTTKREGWRRFGIQDGESISDHMYRMSIMTMVAPPPLVKRLDIQRCTRMALVHDMAESFVGDLTPRDGVPKPEKSRREDLTMKYLCSDLLGAVHGGKAGAELRALWREYEDDITEEAHFVHDIDKMELLLQMFENEKKYQHLDGQEALDLGEFSWVSQKIRLPEIKEWARELLKEREVYWKKVGKQPVSHWPDESE